jgi:hypothetical protein
MKKRQLAITILFGLSAVFLSASAGECRPEPIEGRSFPIEFQWLITLYSGVDGDAALESELNFEDGKSHNFKSLSTGTGYPFFPPLDSFSIFGKVDDRLHAAHMERSPRSPPPFHLFVNSKERVFIR